MECLQLSVASRLAEAYTYTLYQRHGGTRPWLLEVCIVNASVGFVKELIFSLCVSPALCLCIPMLLVLNLRCLDHPPLICTLAIDSGSDTQSAWALDVALSGQ